MYKEFIESLIKQLKEYADEQPIDMILLHNHLELVKRDIQNNTEFKRQLEGIIH